MRIKIHISGLFREREILTLNSEGQYNRVAVVIFSLLKN